MMHNVLVPVPNDLSLDTQRLVIRFAAAMAEKLNAAERKGRGGWEKPDWQLECTEQLYVHLEKGDPVDVANFCAFMWHHKWSTRTPTVMTQDLGENDKLLLVTSKALTTEQTQRIKDHFDAMLQGGQQCIVASGFENVVVIRRPQIEVIRVQPEAAIDEPMQEEPKPVAWRAPDGFGDYVLYHERLSDDFEPLFAAPPVKAST